MIVSPADPLRLVVVPAFVLFAHRDARTRRIDNQVWFPLYALGFALLAYDGWRVATGQALVDRPTYLAVLALSLGLVAPLAYLLWWFGGFGGADAKALIALAIIFPAYPTFYFDGFTLPLVQAPLGSFSLTILTNTMIAAVVYPLAIAVRNFARGDVATQMFVGKRVIASDVVDEYGSIMDSSGLSRTGLDLDALRMYLQWRRCSLAELLADPDHYRRPESLPTDRAVPDDGRIATEGDGTNSDRERATTSDEAPPRAADSPDSQERSEVEDPWGAATFLEEIDGDAYGTTPETLREGLDTLASQPTVWISPGIPFLVPMTAGLIAALTVGDILALFLF